MRHVSKTATSAKYQGKHLQLTSLALDSQTLVESAYRLCRTPRREDVSAHHRWLEIHITNTSTSTATIELLCKSFASLCKVKSWSCDNAAAFTGEEFTEFLMRNGIRHVRTPPYHPASNGLVERTVQIGDTVYVRNYGPGLRWLAGMVVDHEEYVMYQVRLSDNRIVCRHADQLRSGMDSCETQSNEVANETPNSVDTGATRHEEDIAVPTTTITTDDQASPETAETLEQSHSQPETSESTQTPINVPTDQPPGEGTAPAVRGE